MLGEAMSILLSIVFWGSTIALVFPHLLYLPSLYILSRFRRVLPPGQAQPSVTLVVSAYNEQEVIAEKIENALQLDYPPELLEVIVISDASSDETDQIVEQYSHRNVRLYRQEERQGKSAGLTRFCPMATGEILVFTDANSMFQADAIAKLVRHFDNPDIGFTVGKQLYSDADSGASADSENVYWSIELKLKEWESRLNSVVGADGAIYALRKEFFEPLLGEDINDFLLPLKVIVKGYRGVFDTEAICYEDAAPDFRGEFRRKYRIVNRSMRAVTKVPHALNPLKVGWFAFELFGHKVLRWFGPLFMILMLVTSLILASSEITEGAYGFFSAMLMLQLVCYLIAAMYLLPPFRRVRLVYIAYYFLIVNVAAGIGLGLLATGRTIGTWKPQR